MIEHEPHREGVVGVDPEGESLGPAPARVVVRAGAREAVQIGGEHGGAFAREPPVGDLAAADEAAEDRRPRRMIVIDGCAGGTGQTGGEKDRRQARETPLGSHDAEAHWRAPPQLDPAPAVQPKQWRPVAIGLPARRSSELRSHTVRGPPPRPAPSGSSSIWLKSQS